jgi:predicted DNA-binding protein YlxM (UPF0122 family)
MGRGFVDECIKRALAGEAGYFYAMEGGHVLGTPFPAGEPIADRTRRTPFCGARPSPCSCAHRRAWPVARIDWVEARLNNWALWSARGRNYGQGFASQSSFLNVVVDGSRYREASIPVDEVEAGITDEAVSALMPDRPRLHETLVLYYLEGLSALGVAQHMHVDRSTVHANLGQADAVLSVWFTDRKRRKEWEARELQAKLQAARSPRLDAVVLPEPPKRRAARARKSFTP